MLEEEQQVVVDNLSSSDGYILKSLQFGVQRLPLSKIRFSLQSASSSKVRVYFVNNYDYILGTPGDDEAVIHELSRTSGDYEIDIPRIYTSNNNNQWTYASFYSVYISLVDGDTFPISNMQLFIASQRILGDNADSLIR